MSSLLFILNAMFASGDLDKLLQRPEPVDDVDAPAQIQVTPPTTPFVPKEQK